MNKYKFVASIHLEGELIHCEATWSQSTITAERCYNDDEQDRHLTPLQRARTEAMLYSIACNRGLIQVDV